MTPVLSEVTESSVKPAVLEMIVFSQVTLELAVTIPRPGSHISSDSVGISAALAL